MIERFDESLERPYEPSLDDVYVRQLGALGIVDALIDAVPTMVHPEDDTWVVRSNN